MEEFASGGPGAPCLVADLPRVLAFYQDVWDGNGTAIGWRTVAWGLALADGAAVTVPADGPPSATLWPSVGDAAESLDAFVDAPVPARRLIDPAASSGEPRASATPRLSSPDGMAAQSVCPRAQPVSSEDRPLGRTERTDDSGPQRGGQVS